MRGWAKVSPFYVMRELILCEVLLFAFFVVFGVFVWCWKEIFSASFGSGGPIERSNHLERERNGFWFLQGLICNI